MIMNAEVGKPYEFTEDDIIQIVDTHALFDMGVMFTDDEKENFKDIQNLFNEKEDV